jgi:hypothetical protein
MIEREEASLGGGGEKNPIVKRNPIAFTLAPTRSDS